jgi:CHAD domain-containing protein
VNVRQKVKESWDHLSAAIKDCSENPTEDAVHHVRTRCRRMEALVSSLLSTHSGNANLGAAGTAVLRKLKKIRREAGAVRDLDIHSLLLDSLHDKTPAQQPDKAAKKLKKALKQERKRLATSMLKIIEAHKGKLETKATAFIKIFDGLPASEQQLDTVALATARFLETSAAMPVLRAENLHEFRKQSKAARYVAELNPHFPASARLAEKLNRIQDAIGVWHDWDVMEQETADILDGKGKALRGQMDLMRKKTYREAITVARRTQRELLRHAS